VGITASRFDLTRLKTARARMLRRYSTDVEMKLWQRLRNRQLGVDFRRQHPAGSFVLDFYSPAIGLAIELDGGQHAVNSRKDRIRDGWLAERGVTVLRFWNSDLTSNLPGVLETIAATISDLQSSKLIPTRRWRADLPFSRGGDSPRGRA
jgi:very-short-patch-repair endonuclease